MMDTEHTEIPQHVASVDRAIVKVVFKVVLPELFYLLNEAVEQEGKPLDKDTKLRIKKVLPPWCTQSFEHANWVSRGKI